MLPWTNADRSPPHAGMFPDHSLDLIAWNPCTSRGESPGPAPAGPGLLRPGPMIIPMENDVGLPGWVPGPFTAGGELPPIDVDPERSDPCPICEGKIRFVSVVLERDGEPLASPGYVLAHMDEESVSGTCRVNGGFGEVTTNDDTSQAFHWYQERPESWDVDTSFVVHGPEEDALAEHEDGKPVEWVTQFPVLGRTECPADGCELALCVAEFHRDSVDERRFWHFIHEDRSSFCEVDASEGVADIVTDPAGPFVCELSWYWARDGLPEWTEDGASFRMRVPPDEDMITE